ncbi:alpha/beta fold hydrolase [Paludisphaera mucosa]|uniref:Alpha/beta hydrolase n=1 Tax=Paludisphaera mucosa TaxID=3030827 RepID=A0ABT6FC77_9BACT|nr:alpha/beta hydrolase [Paludisphaera mucosa]MDG3004990.1 alpha/beta hydrolase [Paludisphaera mucosa]
MRTRSRVHIILFLLGAASAPGCHAPSIKERPSRAIKAAYTRVLGCIPGSAAATSSEEFAYSQAAAQVEASDVLDPGRLLALADEADAIGSRLARRDPVAALPWFRDAAAYSAFALASAGPADPPSALYLRACDLHDHAVEELVRGSASGSRSSTGSGAEVVEVAWRERLAASGVAVAPWSPGGPEIPCHELWVAADFRVKNIDHVGREGLGVPLVALTRFPDRKAVPDRFLPERLRLPATAVLSPNGPLRGGAWRSQPATLALHDPIQETTVVPAPGAPAAPLAADLTTPLVHQVLNSTLQQLRWGGLLRPTSYNTAPGIFMGAPYRPGKIPVLFVHGLWSSPDAWMKMTNDLEADPLIRERYQFWYAYYPTGAPLMFSAARVRQALHELREAVDPGRADPALDQMVVVGHSLGGVLSKQLVQSSGRRLEQGLLTRPLEQVALSPETREALSRVIYFEPEPSIRRVVFVAAPHRGSNTANQVVGRLSSSLISRAGAPQALHAEVLALNGPDVLQPAYRRRPPTSIDNLEWESPILTALSELRIAPGVPYHSIVANLFPEAPPRFWTDGVVPYESAHVEGAESEIMIRGSHLINDAPEAAAEVRRILRLHLGN